MSQSKLGSFVEAVMNTFIGYWISFALQLVVYPAFGAKFSIMQNLWIGLIFMVASLVRSYVIRRWFNTYIHKAALKVTGETG